MHHPVSSLHTPLNYRAFEDTADARALAERAHPGLHAEVLQQMLQHVVTRGSLLDLGCGTGAWLARLQQRARRESPARG